MSLRPEKNEASMTDVMLVHELNLSAGELSGWLRKIKSLQGETYPAGLIYASFALAILKNKQGR